nr:RecName: Full=20 kDa cell wall protein [Solanum lycopersicum]
EYIPFIHEWV